MAKIKSEDLRLNIIVNGDAGRKEILDTEKEISKLTIGNTVLDTKLDMMYR